MIRRRRPLIPDPAKVRAWRDRTRRALPKQSARRRSERRQRAAVIAAVAARDGWQCSAAGRAVGGCWGQLDGHELASRGVRPGGHLDAENVVLVCRGHHEWITAHPREAEALGLRRWSWEV